MPTIPRNYLTGLSDAINEVTRAGRDALAVQLRQIVDASDGAGPIDMVRDVLDVLEPMVQAVTGDTAALSAQSYDIIRTAAIGDPYGALPTTGRDPAWTERAVYGMANQAGGDAELFVESVLDRLDYEAKRAAGYTTVANGQADRARPRFARVPTGSETCPFCIMLASRGFVYHSARKAGALDHYHPNCDCRIVPCFDSVEVLTAMGAKRRLSPTVYEGYDPNRYFDRYLDDISSGRLKLKAVRRNVATRNLVRQFGGYGEAKRYIDGATDVDELQVRLAAVNEAFPKPDDWDEEKDWRNVITELYSMIKRKYQELLAETGVEYDAT